MTLRKPKIGLLGIMTEAYEPIFPGITRKQESFAQELVACLNEVVDISFPKIAVNKEDIEKIMQDFNNEKLDGVLIVLLTYSPGIYMLRALQNNHLPIALAVVQPEQTVRDEWEEFDFTINQGIHGAQDNSNVIVRAGLKCQFFAGNRHEKRFKEFVLNFGKAAQAYNALKNMRVAIIGRMAGMGDVMGDDMAFHRKVGPEFVHENIGTVYKFMVSTTEKEIEERVKFDRETFEIDPKLSYESHAYAVRLYFGFKKLLEEGSYDAFTAHFEVFGADGRFKQLPLLAASHLMAEGYGYAAEGDAITAAMVRAAHQLGNRDANFSEMYAMDFERKSLVFCHAGEGNWATCRKDMKPRLIDRYLGEGGLENPPTPIFTPQPGRATVVSLTNLSGERFRMIVSKGEILPKSDLKRCDMPYIFYRPNTGVENCIEAWLRNGGTHHEVINLGDCTSRWKMLCDMLDIEYVEV